MNSASSTTCSTSTTRPTPAERATRPRQGFAKACQTAERRAPRAHPRPRTPCATWSGSGSRSATRSSPTPASPTGPTSVRSTPRSTRGPGARARRRRGSGRRARRGRRQQAEGLRASLQAFLRTAEEEELSSSTTTGDPARRLDRARGPDRRTTMAATTANAGPGRARHRRRPALYSGWPVTRARSARRRARDANRCSSSPTTTFRRDTATTSARRPAFLVISCLDGPTSVAAPTPSRREARPRAEARRTSAPRTSTSGSACSYWPVPPVQNRGTYPGRPRRPPIVVVGTTGDPATPIVWAEGLAGELGTPVLITVDGTTHTSVATTEPLPRPGR